MRAPSGRRTYTTWRLPTRPVAVTRFGNYMRLLGRWCEPTPARGPGARVGRFAGAASSIERATAAIAQACLLAEIILRTCAAWTTPRRTEPFLHAVCWHLPYAGHCGAVPHSRRAPSRQCLFSHFGRRNIHLCPLHTPYTPASRATRGRRSRDSARRDDGARRRHHHHGAHRFLLSGNFSQRAAFSLSLHCFISTGFERAAGVPLYPPCGACV